MSDLTDKQWQEYFAKSERDLLWRALGNLRSAQASFQILGHTDIYGAIDKLANLTEERLKLHYGDIEKKWETNNGPISS